MADPVSDDGSDPGYGVSEPAAIKIETETEPEAIQEEVVTPSASSEPSADTPEHVVASTDVLPADDPVAEVGPQLLASVPPDEPQPNVSQPDGPGVLPASESGGTGSEPAITFSGSPENDPLRESVEWTGQEPGGEFARSTAMVDPEQAEPAASEPTFSGPTVEELGITPGPDGATSPAFAPSAGPTAGRTYATAAPDGERPWWMASLPADTYDENIQQGLPQRFPLRATGINPELIREEPATGPRLLPPKSPEEARHNWNHLARLRHQETHYQLGRDLDVIFPESPSSTRGLQTPISKREPAAAQVRRVWERHLAASQQMAPESPWQPDPDDAEAVPPPEPQELDAPTGMETAGTRRAAKETYVRVLEGRGPQASPRQRLNAVAGVTTLMRDTGELVPPWSADSVLQTVEQGRLDLDEADLLARAALPDSRLVVSDDPATRELLETINTIAVPGPTADLFASRFNREAQPSDLDGRPAMDPVPGVPSEVAWGWLRPHELQALGQGSIPPADLAAMEAVCQAMACAVHDSGYHVPRSSGGPAELPSPARVAAHQNLNEALRTYGTEFRRDPGSAETRVAWDTVEEAKTAMMGEMGVTTFRPTALGPGGPVPIAPGTSEVARLTAQAQANPVEALYQVLPSYTPRAAVFGNSQTQITATGSVVEDSITLEEYTRALFGGSGSEAVQLSSGPTASGDGGAVTPGSADPGASPDAGAAGGAGSGGVTVLPELPGTQGGVGDPNARPDPGPPLDVSGDTSSRRPVDRGEFDPNRKPEPAGTEGLTAQLSFPKTDQELLDALQPDGPGVFASPPGREDGVPAGESAGPRPGSTRVGSDGQTQTLVNTQVLVGDDRPGTVPGRVDFFRAADGTTDAVVTSPRRTNADGTTTVWMSNLGTSVATNPAAQTVTSVQRVTSGEYPAGTTSQAVTIRTGEQTRPFTGGGAGSVPGSVTYEPVAGNPRLQNVVVRPTVTEVRNADGSGEVIYTALVPENRSLNATGAVERFQVAVGTPMRPVSRSVHVPAPVLAPQPDAPAPSPALSGGTSWPAMTPAPAPGSRPRPASGPVNRPAAPPTPARPAPARQVPTWQQRAEQVGETVWKVITTPHPLDPFRGPLKDVWPYVPGLPMPSGQREFGM